MKRFRSWISLAVGLLATSSLSATSPSAAATASFNNASREVEQRLLARQCTATSDTVRSQLRSGAPILEDLGSSTVQTVGAGALLHHWRGVTFAAGAHAVDFESLLRNFQAYPQTFAPDVASAHVLSGSGSHFLGTMRVRQHHVITVVLDATYDVRSETTQSGCGYSISRSTRIDEIASPGASSEHALSPAENHGFLWRQDVFWSYEERDGGLYLQIETLSLSRDVPAGLGWIVRPFVDSIPHESLEFTLRSAVRAIRR